MASKIVHTELDDKIALRFDLIKISFRIEK